MSICQLVSGNWIRFYCTGNFVWRKQWVMAIVNGNAKIYMYYHFYCFSNVQRSILKWYIISIWMKIVFSQCGGAEVILMLLHPPFHTFLKPIPHQKCSSTPVHSVEVPTSAYNVAFSNLFRNPILRSNHSLFSEFWCETSVSRRFYVSMRSFTQWRHINVILASFFRDETGVSMYQLILTYCVNFSSENERFPPLIKIFSKNLHLINHIMTSSKNKPKNEFI